MTILALAASHRKESINRKLINLIARVMNEAGTLPDVVEYGEFDAPIYDDELFVEGELPSSVQCFISRLSAAKALVIASPEYNWSFPGSLKNLIDWSSVHKPNPFMRKPVLLVAASPSLRGGAQGLVQLTTPLAALGAFVYPRLFTLSRAESLFAEDGSFKDAKLAIELQVIVQDFLVFAQKIM